MKRIRLLSLLLLVLAVAILGVVSASALGGYTLNWWTVDGGGATSSTGGSYSLGGGTYALSGGFWGGGSLASIGNSLFLPLILR
jgi:hypothetical protein